MVIIQAVACPLHASKSNRNRSWFTGQAPASFLGSCTADKVVTVHLNHLPPPPKSRTLTCFLRAFQWLLQPYSGSLFVLRHLGFSLHILTAVNHEPTAHRSLRKNRRKQKPLMVQPGNVGFGYHWVLGEVDSLSRFEEALPDLSLQIDRFLQSALQGLERVHEGLGRGFQSSQPSALCHPP